MDIWTRQLASLNKELFARLMGRRAVPQTAPVSPSSLIQSTSLCLVRHGDLLRRADGAAATALEESLASRWDAVGQELISLATDGIPFSSDQPNSYSGEIELRLRFDAGSLPPHLHGLQDRPVVLKLSTIIQFPQEEVSDGRDKVEGGSTESIP